jgi:hypothetical protein
MADFNEVGFLSDELTQWTKNAHDVFADAFGIAHRMNRMGMRMLWELPTENLTEPKVWAVAGYARSLEAFQSCLLLAERGALAEARALARLCAESVIVTAGLLKVEGTLEKLKEDGAKHRLALCNRLLEINAKSGDEKALARFEAEKAKVVAEFGKEPKDLKLSPLANKVGLELLYEISFRLTSGNAAHATIGAFERHMRADEHGYFNEFVFAPDASDMRATLLAANAAMVNLIGLAVDCLGMNSFAAETVDLVLHWKVIKEVLEAPDQIAEE